MIHDRVEASLAWADGQISFPMGFIRPRKAERFGNPQRFGSLDDGGEGVQSARIQRTGGA
jgi:hypothetical protein